nr:PREDICTED: reticulon-4-interacting protein 1 homolog, mitochondrial [Bemisia tabaci]
MSSSKLIAHSQLFKALKLKCQQHQTQRFLAAIAEPKVDQVRSKMKAWQIHSYGGLDELQLSEARLPSISSDRILIKVSTSSVNPLDVAMTNGYGAILLNKIRQTEAGSCEPIVEFPLTLGRDFSGTIIAKGDKVGSEFQIGDEVFGVTQPHESGCHAEFVTAHKCLVHKLPENIKPIEAGSTLYTGLTAWSALKVTGDLAIIPPKNKVVLVIGGAGGVGSAAIQLLKAWDAQVVATCAADAVPLVQSLKADVVIDYSSNSSKLISVLQSVGKYDIILDAAGIPESEIPNYLPLLKEWSLAKFITLKSPLLRNIDENGVINGMILNGFSLLANNLPNLFKGSTVRWGFFMPLNQGVKEIAHLLETGKMKSVIHKEFGFQELKEAYQTVKDGHLRGKVVVKMEDEK